MAHANRGCKWYINKPLLSQAKLTAEENVHTHTTIPLIEWTEIKILLPRAISGGLWNRNCNKFIQKQLNQLQTGQQTRWQGGNRGVSIKNKVMFDMQLSYDKIILGTGEKQKKILVLQSDCERCQWYHEQHCKPRALVPLALPKGQWQQGHLRNGSAWRSTFQTWVWSSSGSCCRGSETTSFRPHCQEKQGGKKKSQLLRNRVRKDWKNILFTIWKILLIEIQNQAVNRATSTQA